MQPQAPTTMALGQTLEVDVRFPEKPWRLLIPLSGAFSYACET